MAILKFETIKPINFFKGQNFQGYSIHYISELNSLLVYGVLSNSDVYLFSLPKKQWTLIKTSGKKPSFRRFYAHYYDNLESIKGLIIHGGEIIQKQKKLKSSDQCYILFTSTWQWRKIFLQDGPSSRQFHQIINFQASENTNQAFIFGGFSKPYQTFLNDLWIFKNIEKLSIKSNKHQVHGCQCKQINTKGQAPYLYGYSAKIMNKKLLFFGGESNSDKKKFQIYVLCLESLNWQKLDIVNKICPALILTNIYESGLDNDKIHIMGGFLVSTNKSNQKCYSLSVRQMEISEQQKSNFPQSVFHTCCITESPLCIGAIEYNGQEQEMQINIMYEKQPNSAVSKHFETDQIQDSKQQVSIEVYLKAIKHEQILSQQLIKKSLVLEQLYKEIQRYASNLYSKYLNDQANKEDQEIQSQKEKSIRSCEDLKLNYTQNAAQFEESVAMIKRLRGQLGDIHEDFQRCIETEMDEQQN